MYIVDIEVVRLEFDSVSLEVRDVQLVFGLNGVDPLVALLGLVVELEVKLSNLMLKR